MIMITIIERRFTICAREQANNSGNKENKIIMWNKKNNDACDRQEDRKLLHKNMREKWEKSSERNDWASHPQVIWEKLERFNDGR